MRRRFYFEWMDALTSSAIHCFGDQQGLLLERLALLRRTQPGLHRLGLLYKQDFVECKFVALTDSQLKLHGKARTPLQDRLVN